MLRKLLIPLLPVLAATSTQAQKIEPSAWQIFPDSAVVKVHPSYNDVSGIHRWLFGENYRKEWAMRVKLPVLKLSLINGGLKPVRQGGGMESKSLRLEDKTAREWVLRSVEKMPDKLLPANLQGTFAIDWVGDEFSGQHPYSALVVPPLAEAARVPHANPVIGLVAEDPALGEYAKIFEGMVCLLEEREPTGPSDNTFKMDRELIKSYDTRLDAETFLRAKMLDLLMGDWDRHEDQWRWKPSKSVNDKIYTSVPRDRDQVFHITQGLFPSVAALPWLDPTLENFDGNIPRVRYSLFKTRFARAYPDMQMTYAEYTRIVDGFVKAETDEVLETALRRLPVENYRLRHDELFAKLRKRRDNIPAAMGQYYKFINRIVDIRATDKDEQITITDGPDNSMHIVLGKSDKRGMEDRAVMDMFYHPDTTREVRIYTSAGDDHITVNTQKTPIRLRIVDSIGHKTFDILRTATTLNVYGPAVAPLMRGNTGRIREHLSDDTANIRFLPTNLYNVWMPLATAALNKDDGFLLGLGFKYTGYDGFRKLPYSTVQQLLITHAFATDAFRIKYNGEWMQAVGKADFTLEAYAQAPDNTMNFFGRGNETVLDKTGEYRRYYRTRFDIYQLDPALRWKPGKGTTISAGPSFQFYHLSLNGNAGRFINQKSLINSYDSSSVNKDKAHAGVLVNLISDHKDNRILPTSGYYLQVNLLASEGINSYSKSFSQIRTEFTYYQKLNKSGSIVLSDRVGGGVTIGKSAFYQSMFLGGQGNLLGYLQNRFAGQHMVFNNFQARVKLADIASYILPGQLGLTGFYDAGRVWINGEHSDKWHTGTGGGLFFAPASLTVLQVMAGHSTEGWYPYVALNFRI
ncbi:BamA/TamA family outer membrane protein [Mucilaginibacter celer]|nr:BamA/TamA family outer membrane protein [Mucilaginibacter celer]